MRLQSEPYRRKHRVRAYGRHLCATMRATMSAMVSRIMSADRSVVGLAVAPKGNTGDHAVASAMTAIRISAGGESA